MFHLTKPIYVMVEPGFWSIQGKVPLDVNFSGLDAASLFSSD